MGDTTMGIGNKETVYDLVAKRPIPEGFNPDAPFKMEIDKITDTEDTSIIVHGYIKSGCIHLGDKVRTDGLDAEADIYEIRIHYTDKRVDFTSARQGDRVRLTLRGIDKHLIHIGDKLYK